MNNSKKTLKIINDLSKTNIYDDEKINELLQSLKVSSYIDAQNYIDKHVHSKYLEEHEFIAEEDDTYRLTIRPLRIMMNYFQLFDRDCLHSDVFVKTYEKEIMEILTAIETPEEDLEEEFKNFTGLLHDVNAVNAINILDDEVN